MQSNIKKYLGSLIIILVLGSCVKQKFTTPELAEFASSSTGNSATYYVADDPNSVFKVPVGITTSAGKDRTIQFTVSSPSGATEGQQYTIGTNSVTIPAGQVVDSIPVKGIFAGLGSGRVDTLIITISGGDAAAFPSYSKYTLILRQYCPVVSLTDFEGNYDNTFDDASYGPYHTEIVAGTITGTKGTITIKNLWDFGFNDIPVTLDWTDKNNFILTFTAQATGIDAGNYDPSQAGKPLWIYPAGPGSFSSCEQTFTVRYQLGIPNVGKYPAEFTILSR